MRPLDSAASARCDELPAPTAHAPGSALPTQTSDRIGIAGAARRRSTPCAGTAAGQLAGRGRRRIDGRVGCCGGCSGDGSGERRVGVVVFAWLRGRVERQLAGPWPVPFGPTSSATARPDSHSRAAAQSGALLGCSALYTADFHRASLPGGLGPRCRRTARRRGGRRWPDFQRHDSTARSLRVRPVPSDPPWPGLATAPRGPPSRLLSSLDAADLIEHHAWGVGLRSRRRDRRPQPDCQRPGPTVRPLAGEGAQSGVPPGPSAPLTPPTQQITFTPAGKVGPRSRQGPAATIDDPARRRDPARPHACLR